MEKAVLHGHGSLMRREIIKDLANEFRQEERNIATGGEDGEVCRIPATREFLQPGEQTLQRSTPFALSCTEA